MDLSKLSTADLEALRDGDLSRVSTEGLMFMKGAASSTPAKVEEKPSMLSEIGRQVGLTARHGLEGVGQALDIGAAPIATTLNRLFPAEQKITSLVTGQQAQPRFDTASASLKKAADYIGLPTPKNATERVVGEGAKLMASGGGTLAVSQQAAKLPGLLGEAGKFMAQQPVAQLTAAAGGGMAGQTAAETGQNPYWQAGASLLGTVAGGMTPGLVKEAAGKVAAVLPSSQKQVDIRISSILADAGVDYSKLPSALKDSLRADVSKAMSTDGTLSADAVKRLADIRRVGGTPTVGMLSLDPVQLTREKNVAKMAANMGDESAHGLPRLENQNNSALIGFANRTAGGNADLYSAGERAIGVVRSRDEGAKAIENQLYKQARESAGRNIELSRGEFTNRAFERLAQTNKGAFLPAEVENMLNQISVGQVTKGGKTFPVPFDVDTIDSLKTTLASASRATSDGNVKGAIKAVRDALEETPIESVKRQFGGNQAVTAEGAQVLQAADELPSEALQAFDKARAFARARRNWQESSKGVNSALDGAEPDKFIEQFVLRGPLSDAAGVVKELRKNPQALDVTKQAVVNHLKQKALSGADDEVGKFSQSAYKRALDAIGDRKLSLIFDAKELDDLKALGRAASYMQAQPVGSAVNNSNSGALVMGRAGDALEGLLRVLPAGLGSGMADLSRGARISLTSRQMKDIPKGLLVEQPKKSVMFTRGLLPMSAYTAGLLGAPVSD